jgi:hypothetical protein
MDLDKLNFVSGSPGSIYIPKSINKLNYFRGVVLKEITNWINEYQGDVVYTPDFIMEEVIKPKFYYEWVYDPVKDVYTQKNLSLKNITDAQLYKLINDCVIWAEMTFEKEITKPR